MNEKAITGNLLTLVKNICNTCFHATLEENNIKMEKHLKEYLEIHKRIYSYMNEKDYYNNEDVENYKIEKVKNAYCDSD